MLYGKDLKKSDVISQVNLDAIETFDDFIEIILEFAYMTIFAESAPFAPIFIIIFNTIEIRSDLFKLTTVHKRPQCVRKRSIGIWYQIMQIISFLSVFTNLLFTFAYKGYQQKTTLDGIGVSQLLIFFVVEHSVLIIILLLRIIISSKAKWVQLFYDRRDHRLKNQDVKITLFKKLFKTK